MLGRKRLEVQLTEIKAKVDANGRVSEEVMKAQLSQLMSQDRRLSEVKTEINRVRDTAADDLRTHVHAVNPHPEQEQWIREHAAALGREISALTRQITEWQGSLKVFGAVYVLVTAVGTGLLVKLLGG